MATGSELIVLDDVSAALDAPTERELWTNLRKAGVTIIAASHSNVAKSMADQVIDLGAPLAPLGARPSVRTRVSV